VWLSPCYEDQGSSHHSGGNSNSEKLCNKPHQESSQNASCREVASQESSQNAFCYEVAAQQSSQNASCYEVATQQSSLNDSCYEVTTQQSSLNASCYEVATQQSSLNASCYEVATQQSSQNASCFEVANQQPCYNCSREEEPEPTPTLEDEAAPLGGLRGRPVQECILTCLILLAYSTFLTGNKTCSYTLPVVQSFCLCVCREFSEMFRGLFHKQGDGRFTSDSTKIENRSLKPIAPWTGDSTGGRRARPPPPAKSNTVG
jgi:hypothetical protein